MTFVIGEYLLGLVDLFLLIPVSVLSLHPGRPVLLIGPPGLTWRGTARISPLAIDPSQATT